MAFGGVERTKEEGREAWGVQWLEDLVQGVSYAARGLARTPLFTATVAVTLALALGAGVVAGLVPALQVSRADLADSLTAGSLQSGSGRSRLPAALVIARSAPAFVLPAVSALASLIPAIRATRVDPVVALRVE